MTAISHSLCGFALAAMVLGTPCPSLAAPPVRDERYLIESHTRSWKEIKEAHVVMQKYDYSCGAAALATVARYYWNNDVTEKEFLEAILRRLSAAELKDRVEKGLTMTDLRNAANACGYQATMGKRTPAQMIELKVPVIVRITINEHEHFVVFRGLAADRVYLADSIRGNVRQSFDRFLEQWSDGVVLVIAKRDAKELPKDSPLVVRNPSPVQPELQTVRRMLVVLPP